MVHGNNIAVYYGITLTEKEYNIIKKLVSLEYKDLFNRILNLLYIQNYNQNIGKNYYYQLLYILY